MLSAPKIVDLIGEDGFAIERGLLSASECARFLRDATSAPTPLDWHKGHAATSRAFYEIAADPKIVDLVTELLGENVMLWGASILEKAAQVVHPWHTDIESFTCGGKTVSVWIGLENTTRESSLTVVPRSHRFGATVQEERLRHEKDRDGTANIDILHWAKMRDPGAELLELDLSDGDALIFDGLLWHSSNNLSGKMRRALLLQYASPATPIRLPDLAHLDWPFRSLKEPRPPCVIVRGAKTVDVNRIVPPPIEVAAGAKAGAH